jgi:hypothetical protein
MNFNQIPRLSGFSQIPGGNTAFSARQKLVLQHPTPLLRRYAFPVFKNGKGWVSLHVSGEWGGSVVGQFFEKSDQEFEFGPSSSGSVEFFLLILWSPSVEFESLFGQIFIFNFFPFIYQDFLHLINSQFAADYHDFFLYLPCMLEFSLHQIRSPSKKKPLSLRLTQNFDFIAIVDHKSKVGRFSG